MSTPNLEWRRPNGQSYPEYLETMRAYSFIPMDYDLWVSWQLHWMAHYAHIHGVNAGP